MYLRAKTTRWAYTSSLSFVMLPSPAPSRRLRLLCADNSTSQRRSSSCSLAFFPLSLFCSEKIRILCCPPLVADQAETYFVVHDVPTTFLYNSTAAPSCCADRFRDLWQFFFCTDRYSWEWSEDAVQLPRQASDSLCLTMDSSVISGLEESEEINAHFGWHPFSHYPFRFSSDPNNKSHFFHGWHGLCTFLSALCDMNVHGAKRAVWIEARAPSVAYERTSRLTDGCV